MQGEGALGQFAHLCQRKSRPYDDGTLDIIANAHLSKDGWTVFYSLFKD